MVQFQNEISAKVATIMYFSVQLVSAVFSASIVDRTGRRPLLIASSIGTVVALSIETVYFYLKSTTELDLSSFSLVPLVALIVFVVTFSLGLQIIPLLMLGELFPANVKAFALCFADIYYCLLASTVSKFFQLTDDYFGMYMPFFGFAVCSLLGLGAIIMCVPETKSKTLEEIQIYFTSETQNNEKQKQASVIDMR